MSSLEHRKISTLPIILASTQKRYVVSFTIFSGSWLKVALTRANRALQRRNHSTSVSLFLNKGGEIVETIKTGIYKSGVGERGKGHRPISRSASSSFDASDVLWRGETRRRSLLLAPNVRLQAGQFLRDASHEYLGD